MEAARASSSTKILDLWRTAAQISYANKYLGYTQMASLISTISRLLLSTTSHQTVKRLRMLMVETASRTTKGGSSSESLLKRNQVSLAKAFTGFNMSERDKSSRAELCSKNISSDYLYLPKLDIGQYLYILTSILWVHAMSNRVMSKF